jgi:predicted lysophospholipase L1 biosynthesis ABC-type transport system permease subunit
MKARLYWSYTLRSLARGGIRTALAILCVAVGVLALVALQLVIDGAQAGIGANGRRANGSDIAVNSSAAPLTPIQLGFFARLRAAGTITAYTAVDAQPAQVRAPAGTLHLQLLAVDPAAFPLAGGVAVTAPRGGTLPAILRGTGAAITTQLAQALRLRVGDRMRFVAQDGRWGSATVAGVVEGTGLLTGSLLLIAQHAYAALPGATQAIGTTDLYLDVPGHAETRAAAVKRLIRHQFPLATASTAKEALDAYQKQIGIGRAFLQVVGLLALLIGGVGIMNSMQVALRRRRIEIAALKTAGYRRRDLYVLFGLEAALIGLAGGVMGAAAGAGASLLLQGLVERVLGFVWPTAFDARALAAGVAIGVGTALIFGLLPIVQASEVRPQAVLRGSQEEAGRTNRLLTAGLVALLAALFIALASGILGDLTLALAAVCGTGAVLGVLGLVIGSVVVALAALPIPEVTRPWQVVAATLALVAGVGLTVAQPALGLVVPVVAMPALATLLAPRAWRWHLKLALRTIGRQKGRSIATLLALCIGAFAIGTVVVLGQNIMTSFAQTFGGKGVDAVVVTSGAGRAEVADALHRSPGARGIQEITLARAMPLAIDGRPFGPFARAAVAAGKHRLSEITDPLSGVQGYDLRHHALPNPRVFTLAQGARDTGAGRLLRAVDAGSDDAVLPVAASQAPLDLRLGDTVTVAGAGRARQTLTVVGFYQGTLDLQPIVVDRGVAVALAAHTPLYGFYADLAPAHADATLAAIQTKDPAAQTYSLADLLANINTIIDNATTAMIAVASLALLAAIVLIANAVALLLLERRRELGIFKAVGYTGRRVLGGVLLEHCAIGLVGGLLALLLLAAVTPVLGSLIAQQTFSVPAVVVVAMIPATVALAMAVAASVAWSATRVPPLEVLRYE